MQGHSLYLAQQSGTGVRHLPYMPGINRFGSECTLTLTSRMRSDPGYSHHRRIDNESQCSTDGRSLLVCWWAMDGLSSLHVVWYIFKDIVGLKDPEEL